MAQISRKDRKRLRDLHARMCSDNSGERDAAWRKLDALLKRLGKSWNDLPELLHDETNASAPRTDPRDADQSAPNVGANITPADTVRYMLEEYVALDEHEYVAVALWIIHTHVFDKFMVTPRLLAQLRQDHPARRLQFPGGSGREDGQHHCGGDLSSRPQRASHVAGR
jgi:hypothetical protein